MARKRDGKIQYIDYSDKMPDLNFKYDEQYYPSDDQLPDPQIEPVIPGARIPIRKVGIAPVDLPVLVQRRDGGTQVLQAEASLYCSLDNPDAKGLNLSRLYLMMHESIKDHLTLEGIKGALERLAKSQGSKHAYCKLRFKYPWTQDALRSVDENGNPLHGHIAYGVELEGRLTTVGDQSHVDFYLTVDYIYSSTCPCSFELAHDATSKRQAAANAHSQRSKLRVTVKFSQNQMIWIEDIVELCRLNIPTEVQIVVKRRDEQAFAELNGSNLLFSEDVCRIMYEALDTWWRNCKIQDFSIVVEHMESLHPWEAIALTSKFDPGAVPGCLS